MRRWLFRVTVGVAVVVVLGVSQFSTTSHAQASSRVESADDFQGFLEQYCLRCHTDRRQQAGAVPVSLEGADVDDVGAHADLWEEVVRRVRAGLMPPMGSRGPDPTTRLAAATWLERELDRAAASNPPPGRPMTAHRLNRTEYRNAVRDLFGLDVNVEALLPPDDVSAEGFDNNADTLSTSTTLMERYLAAARRISQLAIGDPAMVSRADTYRVPQAEVQDDRTSEDLPWGTRGGLAVEHYFPLDGEYVFKIGLRRNFYNYIRGLGNTPHQLDVRVDKMLVGSFTVGGAYDGPRCPTSFCGRSAGDPGVEGWDWYSVHADDDLEVRVPVEAGQRMVSVAFVKKPAWDEGILQPVANPAAYGYSTDDRQEGNPAVSSLDITGPFGAQAPMATAVRDAIFVCHPAAGADEAECAGEILGRLARRAYRRPVTPDDLAMLRGFYDVGRRDGTFDTGIQMALEYLLTDPEFLFRVEGAPPGDVEPGVEYPVTDLELASRLSFFLWASIPDDELLDLAARGRLSEPEELERQVRRMLATPRARTTLAERFFGQWLGLSLIRNAAPDPTIFPAFDENLRDAMDREAQLFLEAQLREDRPVVELLTADYTFVNERLARHYGIPNIHGNHFRRVEWQDDRRAGLLGLGSVLTLTSYANRTSPVARGKWVLEILMGTPPPEAPADVPGLEEREPGEVPTSLRDRMALHRANPVCASCHRMMDPLGFALENFDAIGRWRTTEETGIPGEIGPVIDASGTTPDGSEFDGAAGLRTILASREDQFVGAVIERFLTYALGRTLEASDMPMVRQIERQAEADESRWSAVILSIVSSRSFQTRRAG